MKSTPSESHRVEIQVDKAGGGASRAAQGWAASDVGLLTLKLRSPLSIWTRLTVQEVCADANRRHNVEGLCKQFRARLEKVVEKEGDGTGN